MDESRPADEQTIVDATEALMARTAGIKLREEPPAPLTFRLPEDTDLAQAA